MKSTTGGYAGLAILTLAACLATAAPASAQTPHGFYGGGGIGWSNLSVQENDSNGCSFWYYLWLNTCVSDNDYDSGEEEVGFGAHMGYRFNPYIAAEIGYLDAGKPGWGQSAVYVQELGDYADTQSDLEIQAAQISGLAILPFSRTWEIYMRLGASFWKADAQQSVHSPAGDVVYTRSIDDQGTGWLIGLGIGASPTPRWHARLELQSFQIDEDLLGVHGDASVDTVLLELQYRTVR